MIIPGLSIHTIRRVPELPHACHNLYDSLILQRLLVLITLKCGQFGYQKLHCMLYNLPIINSMYLEIQLCCDFKEHLSLVRVEPAPLYSANILREPISTFMTSSPERSLLCDFIVSKRSVAICSALLSGTHIFKIHVWSSYCL